MKQKKIVWALWAITLLGIGLLVVHGPGSSSPRRRPLPVVGEKAPDFTLADLEGRPVSLADFRGKVVLLNFWATWCPPCLEEIPSLETLGKTLRGSPFVILAVSSDNGPRPVERVVRQYGMSFLVVMDPSREAAKSYGTFRYPETYLVDASGKLVRKYIGPQVWSSADKLKAIEETIHASVSGSGSSSTSNDPAIQPRKSSGAQRGQSEASSFADAPEVDSSCESGCILREMES